jgi:hypothetical protein
MDTRFRKRLPGPPERREPIGTAAVWEGEFVGRHVGPWRGIAATGREARAPLCVAYALENDQINTAHLYLDVGSLRRQLGAGA